MKIYAKQVPPEYQESPLFLGEEYWPVNIILDGNPHYNAHTTPLYDRIISAYEEAAQEIENLDLKNGYAAYDNATDVINDYFPALEYREKPYNTRDIHRIREVLRLYGTRKHYNGEYILEMLEAITGETWHTGTIRGCCQGDWQTIYYPVKTWSTEAIEIFETEYFNTGTEWIIHDENADPDGPEDINGFSVYCHSWNTEDIKSEIMNAYGAIDAEVILYQHTGYKKISTWEAV